MLTFVMPVFVDMYSQSGTELPAIIQTMVDVQLIRSLLNIAILIGIVIGLYLFLKYILCTAVIAAKDRLLLRLPVVGDLIIKNFLHHFQELFISNICRSPIVGINCYIETMSMLFLLVS